MYHCLVDATRIIRRATNVTLCEGRVSVRPSVCLFVQIDRQQKRRSAGLLLSALRAGDRAAGAGAQQQMRVESC